MEKPTRKKMNFQEKSVEKFKNSDIPLGALVGILCKTHITYLNNKLKNRDLNGGQLPYLKIINKHENISQDEIAFHLQVDKGTVARTLKKLEDKQLITRTIDPENRRKYQLKITPLGEQATKELTKYDKEWENIIYKELNPFTKEEIQTMLKEIAIETLYLTQPIKHECELE